MSDYELKRINALTEASAIGDDDVFALDSVNGTKKVKWSTIDGKVGDKVDGMLAVATVPNAEQLIAHTGITDTEPYFSRPSASIGDREFDTLVGGTLGWNQLCNGSSVTVESGHKYYMIKGGTASVGASDGTAITGLTSGTDIVIDLTIDFGSTIADYIYSLETAHAGDGVAWARRYLPNTYYAYCAPTLKHVSGVSAHVMRDANNNIIGNYAIDSTWVGMGIPKLDSANKLYFDGDRYASDGTVTEKYGIVDLGTLTWNKSSSITNGFVAINGMPNDFPVAPNTGAIPNWLNSKGYTVVSNGTMDSAGDKRIAWRVYGMNKGVIVNDSAYSAIYESFDADAFKAAMSGVYLVYEKATPTTSSATPFTSPQIVDKDGTEEYVTTGLVPVGHETLYPIDIRGTIETISETPTSDGTYTLKCTVSGGMPTMEWVSE